MLVDSHCHLDSRAFDGDRDEVIQRARKAGVSLMMAIGTGDGPPDLEAAIRIAREYPGITATVGVHPHDARKFDERTAAKLESLCACPEVVAVGEIGLDYHYDNSPRETQQRVFVTQMEIAASKRMPIAIHTRDAWEDTLDLLGSHWAGTGIRGIMHCFTGTSGQALQCLNMGFLLSFSGVLTFARAVDLRATARWTPMDSVLVETDAPYLTPAPYRKIRRNEPRFVAETARVLAELKGVEFKQIAHRTAENYCNLVGLDPETQSAVRDTGISAT